MQSIGERLEEARKRRGISIREASEATKIRGDFLLSFENNQFDIGLPDIYSRGFVRNYAQFLKIDADKLLTDLNSKLIADSKSARKESRELFGRMELPERPRATPEREHAGGESQASRATDDSGRRPRAGLSPEMTNYLKVAGIIAAAIIVILVIVWLMKAIIGAATAPETEGGAGVVQQAPQETITLIALGRVDVRVLRVSDNEEIFSGVLAAGERRELDVAGRVWIIYDNGPNLNLEWRGQRYGMTSEYGRSAFPPTQ